ncbi:setd3 [Symbiodinium sp. CCMP2456]|nr:setd3 [Symbiodinium sp. CCMP2456]
MRRSGPKSLEGVPTRCTNIRKVVAAMAPPHRTPLLVVACAALLAAYVLSEAFAVTTSPKALSPPRLSAQAVGAGLPAQHSSEGYGAVGGAMCGAVAALLAAGGLAVRSQRKSRSVQCNAFSSSSSGFMGTPCASSYVWNHQAAPEPQQPVQAQSGVASMGMKAQVWWIRNNGYDGPAKGGAKLWDSRRRESRRRGEELFRHDVDNFELCVHNLLAAPGSNKRRIQRGRGKYGHHGRTCGYGSTKNGAAKRGRRTLNPGYEGNQKPLHLKTPKLTKDQRDSMKQDPYTPITFWVLARESQPSLLSIAIPAFYEVQRGEVYAACVLVDIFAGSSDHAPSQPLYVEASAKVKSSAIGLAGAFWRFRLRVKGKSGRHASRIRCRSEFEKDAEQYTQLVDWLRARGAYVNQAVGLVERDILEDGDSRAERGCAATQDVRAGELLLEIPLSCCLSSVPGSYDDILSALEPAMERGGIAKADVELALAVAVERQQGEASPWWTYLRMLDCSHTFPLFYDKADLEALENIPLTESLEVTSQVISRIAEASGLPDTEFREAMQLVMGRRFGSDTSRAMMPIGDLLNHRFYPSCEWETPTPDTPCWRLKSKMDLSPGDSLNHLYCEDPNHLLLQQSGFIMNENPHNRIMARPVDLRNALFSVCNSSSPEDFASFRKDEVEKQLPDPDEEGVGLSMFLVGRRPGGLQWNPLWLDMIGLAVTESPDAPHWGTSPEGMEKYLHALETASWSLFPTSLEEDTDDGKSVSSNLEMATALRRGYKVEADWTGSAAVESTALDDELCAKRLERSSANPACVLNMLEDGDEVDYMDLFMRGLPVPSRKRFDRVKIKAKETDELTVKNLTVFAHAFEPAAREKIEENGGRCIRLSDVGSLPIDAKWMSTNEFKVGAGDDSKEEAEGEEAPAEE